jgi:hypothetical protein
MLGIHVDFAIQRTLNLEGPSRIAVDNRVPIPIDGLNRNHPTERIAPRLVQPYMHAVPSQKTYLPTVRKPSLHTNPISPSHLLSMRHPTIDESNYTTTPSTNPTTNADHQ